MQDQETRSERPEMEEGADQEPAAGTEEDKPKKRPLSRRMKKAITKWVALTLLAPVAEKWMRAFDYTALMNNERLLTMIGQEEILKRVGGSEGPIIVALWHNRLMFGPTAYQYTKGRGAVVMVSRSFDGDVIEAVLTRFKNLFAVRGSSQSKKGRDKGGREALAELIEKGKQGLDLVITPDGPLGPRYQVKRGIIDLAKATGYPIFPIAAMASPVLRVKSWDETIIPLPFSRFVYRVGKSMTVPAEADEAMIEQKRQELEASLTELTEFVDHFFDKKPEG
jgi:lysophospholipid acyltransferase (LPLAT)-like uncharacterized protein